METLISKPKEVSADFLRQIIELLEQGGQISMQSIEKRLMMADLIAMIVDNHKVLAVAVLKNPDRNYKKKVFESASADDAESQFEKELGYIVTHPEFEGRKLCQKLLVFFLPHIDHLNLFATTRKDSIVHILGKFGFNKFGRPYRDGLHLLIK